MFMESLELPPNWFKVKISKSPTHQTHLRLKLILNQLVFRSPRQHFCQFEARIV